MGLFKAVSKLVARSTNDAIRNRQMKSLQEKTYEQTGKELRQAKKQGRFVNGAKLYQKNLATNKEKIEQQHNRHDKFIGDL